MPELPGRVRRELRGQIRSRGEDDADQVLARSPLRCSTADTSSEAPARTARARWRRPGSPRGSPAPPCTPSFPAETRSTLVSTGVDQSVQVGQLGARERAHPAGSLVAQPHRARSRCAPAGAPGARPRRATAARCACGPRAAPPRRSPAGPGVCTTRNESTVTGPSSSSTPVAQPPADVARRPGRHLGEVGLGDPVRRVHQPVGELAVVGEQQQALAVGVEPPDVEQPLVGAGSAMSRRRSGRPRSSDIALTTSRAACSARGRPGRRAR